MEKTGEARGEKKEEKKGTLRKKQQNGKEKKGKENGGKVPVRRKTGKMNQKLHDTTLRPGHQSRTQERSVSLSRFVFLHLLNEWTGLGDSSGPWWLIVL